MCPSIYARKGIKAAVISQPVKEVVFDLLLEIFFRSYVQDPEKNVYHLFGDAMIVNLDFIISYNLDQLWNISDPLLLEYWQTIYRGNERNGKVEPLFLIETMSCHDFLGRIAVTL